MIWSACAARVAIGRMVAAFVEELQAEVTKVAQEAERTAGKTRPGLHAIDREVEKIHSAGLSGSW